MIIPVRCYSCGKVIGNLYEPYKALLDQDYTEAEALEALRLERYCCRRMILSHIDLADELIPYSVPVVGTMHQLSAVTTPTPSRATKPQGSSFPAATAAGGSTSTQAA